MPIKVGINGFGRIGRNIMRTALDDKEIQFVAVNDVTDAKTLAHLLKYDSILGNLTHNVTHTDDTISVEGKSFKVFKTKDPGEIDWASVGADIVVESTGLFTVGADAKKHLRGPVKKVIISAPADGPDATFVLGVNDNTYDAAKHNVVFQRIVHDELPRAGRQSSARYIWHSEWHDDDHSLLHERSETARPATQGFAPRQGRRNQYDSELDRRGKSTAPGHPGAERQAGWLRDARSHAERERGGPDSLRGQAGHSGHRQRRAKVRRKWRDEEYFGIHRRRAGLRRFQGQSALFHRRCRVHQSCRRSLRESAGLV